MWSLLIFSLCITTLQARVTFDKSEILDDVDLKGANAASFRCSAGCQVFSPTQNNNIRIFNRTSGTALKSLADLANVEKSWDVTELPGGDYELRNTVTNGAAPSFVFYAVEKGAKSYGNSVNYVKPGTTYQFSSNTYVTIMSSSSSIRFSNFIGDNSLGLPSVYATGFDSANAAFCRPVYTPRSVATLQNTAFPVYSPIATIDFKGYGSRTVTVKADSTPTKSGTEETSSVYVSPGYVGCTNVNGALYTNLPAVTSIDGYFFTNTNANGLNIRVDGDYSIGKEEDSLSLTINEKEQKLFGKGKVSQTCDANAFKVNVEWAMKAGNKDGFALQIDVTKGTGAEKCQEPLPEVKTTPRTTSRPIDATTSSTGFQSLFISCILLSVYLSSL